MAEGHPELDWLARRRAGESIALVARRAGVSEWEVEKATKRFGPFPAPDRQLGRTYLSSVLLEERRQRWIHDRRRGVRVKDIAERDHVNRQTVTRATRGYGPYPSREHVDAWVEARRQGRALWEIAQEFGIRPAVVQRMTRPHGPFVRPSTRTPEGLETRESIARRTGVSNSAVGNWTHLPEPDWITAAGRPVWLSTTIDRWLDTDALAKCQICSARPLDLAIHMGQQHGQSGRQQRRLRSRK